MHATYDNTHNTYENESKHSEMGPVRQNPIIPVSRTHRTPRVRFVVDFLSICCGLCRTAFCTTDPQHIKQMEFELKVIAPFVAVVV